MKTPVILLLALGALHAGGLGQAEETPSQTIRPPVPAPPPSALPKPVEDEYKVRREAAIHSKWNICVDLQMVAMEEARALELIPDLQSDDRPKVDAALVKIQAMIKAKEATLLAWPMVRAVDGDRSVSESVTEQRYPTEFEPPLRFVAGAAPALAAPVPADKPVVEGAIPTAFETRNTGVTLEVEANVLDEGKRVHLSLVPQRVELLEMEKNQSTFDKGKLIVETPQPLFTSSKSTESLTLSSGERQLVAVHKLKKPANYLELHIVRVVVTKSE